MAAALPAAAFQEIEPYEENIGWLERYCSQMNPDFNIDPHHRGVSYVEAMWTITAHAHHTWKNHKTRLNNIFKGICNALIIGRERRDQTSS